MRIATSLHTKASKIRGLQFAKQLWPLQCNIGQLHPQVQTTHVNEIMIFSISEGSSTQSLLWASWDFMLLRRTKHNQKWVTEIKQEIIELKDITNVYREKNFLRVRMFSGRRFFSLISYLKLYFNQNFKVAQNFRVHYDSPLWYT